MEEDPEVVGARERGRRSLCSPSRSGKHEKLNPGPRHHNDRHSSRQPIVLPWGPATNNHRRSLAEGLAMVVLLAVLAVLAVLVAVKLGV